MKTHTPNDESQKRGAEYWQRHQSLVARAGGVVPYMRGAVPRREPEEKAQAGAESKTRVETEVTNAKRDD